MKEKTLKEKARALATSKSAPTLPGSRALVPLSESPASPGSPAGFAASPAASPTRRRAPPTMVDVEIEVPTQPDAPVRAQVDADCTVLEVKQRVEATEGLLAAHQRVLLAGLSLEDGLSLIHISEPTRPY